MNVSAALKFIDNHSTQLEAGLQKQYLNDLVASGKLNSKLEKGKSLYERAQAMKKDSWSSYRYEDYKLQGTVTVQLDLTDELGIPIVFTKEVEVREVLTVEALDKFLIKTQPAYEAYMKELSNARAYAKEELLKIKMTISLTGANKELIDRLTDLLK